MDENLDSGLSSASYDGISDEIRFTKNVPVPSFSTGNERTWTSILGRHHAPRDETLLFGAKGTRSKGIGLGLSSF